MNLNILHDEELLSPAEVAAVFSVDPKTVSRWAAAGKLEHVRTLGGHRRFPVRAVRAALEESHQPRTA